jgi:hypothetical protein
MSSIFLSYSSKDGSVANKLARDLEKLGHSIWFDEWDIKVGECIPSKIEKGIADSDFVVIILTPNSVTSGWVEREWKTKYWQEIEKKETMVLPVLAETCEVPLLLKTKKYADIRNEYQIGIAELAISIAALSKEKNLNISEQVADDISSISQLISKIQSNKYPLSQCIAESIGLAKKHSNNRLRQFCENELTGWDNDKFEIYEGGRPIYRQIELFVSIGQDINPNYIGWGNDMNCAIDYMRKNPKEFIPLKAIMTHPISIIEKIPDNADKKIVSIRLPAAMFSNEPGFSKINVNAYGSSSEWIRLIEAIKTELTKLLLELG